MEISERDYDLLVDTQITVDVMLGSSDITIKEFLNLSEGTYYPWIKMQEQVAIFL